MSLVAGLPDLPTEIKKAADQGRLVLFVGAGLSCAAGLDDWSDLKAELIGRLEAKEGEDLDSLKQNFIKLDYYDCFAEIKKRQIN